MREIQEASAVEAVLAEARAPLEAAAEDEARLLEAEMMMLAVAAEAARLQSGAESTGGKPGRLTAQNTRLSLMHTLLPWEVWIFGRRRLLLMKIRLMNQHRLIKRLLVITSGLNSYSDRGPGTCVTFLGEQSRRYRS